MRNTLRWDNLNREELKKLAEEQAIVVIPTGSTEQHGPALAVGSDAIIITKIAEGVAEEVNRRGKKCIVAPTIAYANSHHHAAAHHLYADAQGNLHVHRKARLPQDHPDQRPRRKHRSQQRCADRHQ